MQSLESTQLRCCCLARVRLIFPYQEHIGETGFGKELRGELLRKIYFFLSIFFMGDVVLVDGPEVERFKTVLSKFPILLRPQGGNGLLIQVLVFLVLTVLLLLDLKRQCAELGIGEYKAE